MTPSMRPEVGSIRQSSLWRRLASLSVEAVVWLDASWLLTALVCCFVPSPRVYPSILAANLLLLDPCLIWLFGRSPGQALLGQRLVTRQTGASPSFVRVLLRHWMKILLGVASILRMAIRKTAHPLHDDAFGTVVCDTEVAEEPALESSGPDVRPAGSVPPLWRRFIAFLLWWFVAWHFLGALAYALALLAPGRQLRASAVTSNAVLVLFAGFALLSIWIGVFAIEGRLPGARRR